MGGAAQAYTGSMSASTAGNGIYTVGFNTGLNFAGINATNVAGQGAIH